MGKFLEQVIANPAWVQAIGSILAILAAAAIAAWQHWRDVAMRKAQDRRYRRTILSIAEQADKDADDIINRLKDDTFFRHEGAGTPPLRDKIKILNTVTLESLPAPEGFTSLYHLRDNLQALVSVAESEERANHSQGVHPESYECAYEARKEAAKQLAIFARSIPR
ncbi:hypothetical protein RSO41_14220 [Halomonas sp. I1]|uniref:hypothetical protein n=1 Tax=Halomonas sp. I1 TaxID=393536 RepID=UPI0028DEC584|nr:hypothetical protein [Halomonas sp. I1]MDT8895809.1 hypothetical protein [Halomonas sp. I1]